MFFYITILNKNMNIQRQKSHRSYEGKRLKKNNTEMSIHSMWGDFSYLLYTLSSKKTRENETQLTVGKINSVALKAVWCKEHFLVNARSILKKNKLLLSPQDGRKFEQQKLLGCKV